LSIILTFADFQSAFPAFVPFQATEAPRPASIFISTQGTSSPAPPSESSVEGPKKDENGEVYRVGPKGRLLRKRKRVRPNNNNRPSSTRTLPQAPTTPAFSQPQPSPAQVIPQQTQASPFVPESSFPPFRPSQQQQRFQSQGPIDAPSPFAPTTYRPNFNALRDTDETEDAASPQTNIESNNNYKAQEEEEDKPTTTTFRSRIRGSKGRGIGAVEGAANATNKPPQSPVVASSSSGSDEEKTKVIASRLKSLERQIRFKNRSKAT
jgi:hypothetical protein